MKLSLYYLILLFVGAYCQTQTLVDQIMNRNQSSIIEQKVMQFLIQSYPQLQNCTLVNTHAACRSDHITELGRIYNHFIFSNQSHTFTVLATLSLSSPNQFVSISPLVINAKDSSTFTSPKVDSPKKHKMGNNKILKRKEFGGYQTVVNTTDVRLDKAESFVESLHPYMINYWREFIQYEIVSGVNFIIEYIGLDSITTATVIVNLNLDQEAQLLTFQIRCQLEELSNLAIPCTDNLALRIFNANQMLIIVRPELLSYKIVAMVSDDVYSPDGMLFIITFENQTSGTRTMVQINVEDNGFTILSQYTYKYPFI